MKKFFTFALCALTLAACDFTTDSNIFTADFHGKQLSLQVPDGYYVDPSIVSCESDHIQFALGTTDENKLEDCIVKIYDNMSFPLDQEGILNRKLQMMNTMYLSLREYGDLTDQSGAKSSSMDIGDQYEHESGALMYLPVTFETPDGTVHARIEVFHIEDIKCLFALILEADSEADLDKMHDIIAGNIKIE